MRLRFLLLFLPVALMGQTCLQTLSPMSRSVPAATNPLFLGTFSVTSNLGTCNWTSTSTAPDWLDVQLGQTGRGNGTVGYAVHNNTTPFERTGTILVGNAVFTVTQAASTCNVTLTLQGGTSIGAEGGSRQLQVTTSCQWTPSSSVSWITATPQNGTGNGTIALSIAPNNTTSPRAGTVSVLGQSVTIMQAAGTCSFSLSPAQQTVTASGGTLATQLTTACAWTAISGASWITITPASTGSGNSAINYSVAANTNSAEARTGTITVGTATLTVQQAGGNCGVQLNPSSAQVAASGGSGTFSVTTSCTFVAVSNVPWISVVAGGNSVTYSVATNTTVTSRTGTITAAGATFTITQAGSACSFTVTPESVDVPPAGLTNGIIQVTTTSGCEWTAITDSAWIRIIGTITGTQGSLQYVVDPNSASAARTGTLTVAGRAISVRQTAGTAPRFASGGIVHSASYQPGGVSPGEIVTIFGEELGPATLATATLEADGQSLTKSLAGTRVLFDGVAAPLLYTSKGQLSAIVPYAVAGKTNVPVIVEYLGARSTPVTARILPAVPALYSLDASGTGPGAIVNQDGTVNSAQTPAVAGQVVLLFATGEGLTDPLQPDGRVTPGVEPLPRPRLKVTVTMGGVECPILYAGAPPGLVAGAMQINVQLPANVPAGERVPIVLTVGEAISPDTVTIAIRR